jgi:hypothetical protein
MNSYKSKLIYGIMLKNQKKTIRMPSLELKKVTLYSTQKMYLVSVDF